MYKPNSKRNKKEKRDAGTRLIIFKSLVYFLLIIKGKSFGTIAAGAYFCTPKKGTMRKRSFSDLVAQLVEHNTFNVGALGSSPSGITAISNPDAIASGFLLSVTPDGIALSGRSLPLKANPFQFPAVIFCYCLISTGTTVQASQHIDWFGHAVFQHLHSGH